MNFDTVIQNKKIALSFYLIFGADRNLNVLIGYPKLVTKISLAILPFGPFSANI